MCLDEGNCHYFLRDPNDGECRGYLGLEAGNCASPYSNSQYYMLFQVNYEPADGTRPGADGGANLLGSRKWCDASYAGLPYANDPQGCADECNNAAGCEFFHFDPADGQCLQCNTDAPNCPEGLRNSSYYDFYAANGGSASAGGPRLLGDGMACPNGGEHFGNVSTNDPQACADKCQGYSGCGYFNYDPNDGECMQAGARDDNCGGQLYSSSYYDFWGI